MKLPFKPWLNQAGSFEVSHISGIPHYNTPVPPSNPRTGVLHTTEGSWIGSMEIFKKHYAPHFMVGYDAQERRTRIAQLVQVGTIGAALKAHNNKALIQVEVVGYSKEYPWIFDADTLEAVSSLLAICAVEYDIPLSRPWKDGDFGMYGSNPHRTSGNYGKTAGWYGHGDCPSPDTHWDPGNLKWALIFKRAKEISNIINPSSMKIGVRAMDVQSFAYIGDDQINKLQRTVKRSSKK